MEQILGCNDYEDWKTLTSDPKSVGHAILSNEGAALSESGLSEMAAPVAANMFDVTALLGELLGEPGGCKRFCVVGTGRRYVCVNYANAAGLVVQTATTQAEIKEFRHVR